MNERPILFSAPMVLAILDDRKTQTRRIVKPQPVFVAEPNVPFRTKDADPNGIIRCPHGKPGDRLWVRETWASLGDSSTITPPVPHQCQVRYAADGVTRWCPVPEGAKGVFPAALKCRPAIHMPRWASRITLEITSVRAERLNAITESDAQDEGAGIMIPKLEHFDGNPDKYRQCFRVLWESINGPGSWDVNPFVWALTFRKL